MRRLLVSIVAVVSLTTVAHAATTGPLHYTTNDGGPKLVIKGDGCLKAEDSTQLKLIDYTPDRIVYRCLIP